jgi:hypothetical protein
MNSTYINNLKINSQGAYLKNYYIINNKYYDDSLTLIDPKNYFKYGIARSKIPSISLITFLKNRIKAQQGKGAKTPSKTSKAKATKKTDKPPPQNITPVALVTKKPRAKKVVVPPKYEITELKLDSIKESGTKYTFYRNLLRKILPQTFSTSYSKVKITSDITKLLKYPQVSLRAIPDSKSNESIKHYDFSGIDGTELKTIIGELIRGGEDVPMISQYGGEKIAFCINLYCFRPARFDEVGKQRQECNQCKAHFIEKKIDPLTGLKNIPKREFNTGYYWSEKPIINKPNYFSVNNDLRKIELSYTNMCYNNFNPSYWGVLPARKNGDDIKAAEAKQDEFQYIVPLTAEQKLLKKEPVRVSQRVNIKGAPYRCELTHYYLEYPTDHVELDHKSGDHFNNVIENIMPLCKMCHGMKTKLQGDKGIGSEGTKIAKRIKYNLLTNKKKYLISLCDRIIININEVVHIDDSMGRGKDAEELKNDIIRNINGMRFSFREYSPPKKKKGEDGEEDEEDGDVEDDATDVFVASIPDPEIEDPGIIQHLIEKSKSDEERLLENKQRAEESARNAEIAADLENDISVLPDVGLPDVDINQPLVDINKPLVDINKPLVEKKKKTVKIQSEKDIKKNKEVIIDNKMSTKLTIEQNTVKKNGQLDELEKATTKTTMKAFATKYKYEVDMRNTIENMDESLTNQINTRYELTIKDLKK